MVLVMLVMTMIMMMMMMIKGIYLCYVGGDEVGVHCSGVSCVC